MQWSPEAEEAIQKVPFFVRKRVRARLEKEARKAGVPQITLAEVKATQQRYLSGMAAEVKGYRLETCFGPSGCPNRIDAGDHLAGRLETLLEKADLLSLLRRRVGPDLKFHHEIRVALADCPNACSQPQIKDIGIIAACLPQITAAECSGCEACVQSCQEDAVRVDTDGPRPLIDPARCCACGQCVQACPTGTLAEGAKGYRVQLGGKLGRHPRLARELPGIYDAETVLAIIQACLEIYRRRSRHGERLGALLTPTDFEDFARRFAPLDHTV
ncbi:4Fe-4S binding protein [Desulfatitalea alkaliphila]|uniref:4Fe-4S binding protein n=1 Tax=Desulfatitalea alkaliphila TaxID=2929485 RepID=A0AA41UPW5_9BACT|nr:4Fe-4S binding protein [Desulfatitalea alkaliphila]MCJ8500848.1 4Fe-4S binding protein [Desulfatitalea alkaliphila]